MQSLRALSLLFDGPQQASALVEVHVVGPAVERGEALVASAGTTTSVVDAGSVLWFELLSCWYSWCYQSQQGRQYSDVVP